MSGSRTFGGMAWLLGLAGLALFVVVIGYQGIGPVAAAVTAVGWGLAWVTLFHLAPLLVDTCAWQILLDNCHRDCHRVGFIELTRIAWIGEAVNSLLPVALIGGGLVRARLLHIAGVPTAIGGASVVVDLTLAVISLVVFSLAGIAVFVANALPGYESARLLPGLLLFSLVTWLFYLAQRRGMFLMLARHIERLNGNDAAGKLSNDAARLDRCVAGIYAHRRKLCCAFLARLFGWVIGAGEVWLALFFLGHPVTVAEALLLESLGQAVRSAAFVIPGALGVQEGAYLMLGASIGVPPHLAVALSLVKRVRELALGVPGLLAWQSRELRFIRRRMRPKASTAEEGR